jgi:hypothetical protein
MIQKYVAMLTSTKQSACPETRSVNENLLFAIYEVLQEERQ